MKKILFYSLIPALLFAFISCGDDNNPTFIIECDYEKEVKKNNVVVSAEEKAYIKNYLDSHDIEATEHELGFYYIISEPGDDVKLEMCYEVSMNYKMYTFDGDYLDLGTNSAFALYMESHILGMRVGVTTIGNGGKVKLFLPPSLGYGDKGSDPAIGPNQYLVFEAEIVDARKKSTYY